MVLFEKEKYTAEQSFICTSIVDGQEYQKLYYLIIIKEMKCNGKTRFHEGDKAELECSIDAIYFPDIIFNYKGHVSKQWFQISSIGKNLTFNVDYSDDKARIVCSIVPKGPQCHFDLQVLYEMMDFETPENKSLEAGEPIECKASGNPSPTVRMSVKRTPTDDDWVFFNSSTSGSAVVYLNESYNGDSSELKCRFESALTNKIIEKIVKLNIVGSKGILGNVASKLQENNYLLLIVIIVIALVVLLIVIAIIIYKRKKNSQKKNKKAEVALLKSEPRKDYKNESV
ncbi:hypothetical protein HELRODRAFT_188051 [Helobdella robusta]|uniref:Ig-like domain-containing protein n=1 Tax=Helobdella robusta TaxID=6412 RepID=T1FPK9_HELRO|nr:hypothetical protein HELRODRAFT_188051 [Helobdella robusta]ESO12942.1 hypothetical protein HELRODRAFT_188051 [Helobdella robusta]